MALTKAKSPDTVTLVEFPSSLSVVIIPGTGVTVGVTVGDGVRAGRGVRVGLVVGVSVGVEVGVKVTSNPVVGSIIGVGVTTFPVVGSMMGVGVGAAFGSTSTDCAPGRQPRTVANAETANDRQSHHFPP